VQLCRCTLIGNSVMGGKGAPSNVACILGRTSRRGARRRDFDSKRVAVTGICKPVFQHRVRRAGS
jgi:hypothetical protein